MSSTSLPENRQFEVEEATSGIRLDRFLAGVCADLSRARLQSLIREGLVTKNGAAVKASETVRSGDHVELCLPLPTPMEGLTGRAMDLAVLAEDKALLVLNKPAGVVVHPGAGTGGDTLVHGLLHYCQDLSGIGGVERPGIVHRLDKETSGCLVVAKTDAAHRELSRQFAEREVKKVYLAVVRGRPRQDSGTVVAPIGRHPVNRQKMTVVETGGGREAETMWRVVAEGAGCSLVVCHPRTGRTHQIRVHLKHLGHPILGDPVYGERGHWERHWLHAWKITLRHPADGEWRHWEAPVPLDFPLLPPADA